MRIVIGADFHLNINNRLEDFVNSLRQILTFILKNKVKLVIFLGDAFQHRKPHPKEQRIFERWVKCLADRGIKVLLMIGNHDENLDTSTIDYFTTLKVDNVKVVRSPYVLKNMYLGHHLLQESEMGPLCYKAPGKNDLSIKQLISKYPQCKMFFLGHIHKHQILNQNPLVMHVGSIERVNFGERNEDKGFVYINDENKVEFIKLKIRAMEQIDIDVNDIVFPGFHEKGSIIKVVVHGTKQDIKEKWDEKQARDIIGKHRWHSVRFVYDIIKDVRTRNVEINERNTPLDCFLKYAKEKEFDKETINKGKEIINEYTTD